jgi:hypothetical protein
LGAVPSGEEIGSFNYGGIRSTLFWLDKNAITVELIDLGNDSFLLRGAKHYYVSDVVEPNSHRNLESIGTFSDYLKEKWPSFELSLLYINSLSTSLAEVNKNDLFKKMEEKRRQIESDKLHLVKLKHDVEYKLASQDDVNHFEKRISDASNELKSLEDDLSVVEKVEREYKDKGTGTTFIIKRQSAVYESSKSDMLSTVNLISTELNNDKVVIKNQAKQGLQISLEELKVPHIGWLSESMGIFDPRVVESLVTKYPKLKSQKENLDKLFTKRWAKEAEIGGSKYRASSAHAQAIDSLLSRASGSKGDYLVPSPDFKRLPQYDKKKRQGFLGLILDGNLEVTKFPFYVDYDIETNYAALGTTRFGKSVAASVFAEGALGQGIPVLVIDPTGGWTGFLGKCEEREFLNAYQDFMMKEPSEFKGKIYTVGSDVGLNLSTNLLSPPSKDKNQNEIEIDAIEVSDIIGKICELSPNEKSKVADLIRESLKEDEYLDYETLIADTGGSVLQKIQKLRGYHFLFEGEAIDDVTTLWKENEISIISLNHLEQSQRMWAAYQILKKIVEYFDRESQTKETKLILIIEEVHQFDKEAYRILEKATRELVKRGVRIFFVTQKLTDLEGLRGNIASRFYFKQEDDNELLRMADDIGNQFRDATKKFSAGMACVKMPDHEPFLVKFRPPFHNTKGLRDPEISQSMLKWKKHPVVFDRIEDVEKEGQTDEDLFLEAVEKYYKTNHEYPYFAEVWKHQLKWKGASKAMKIKNSLIERGKLKEIDDGKFKRLVPT